MKQHRRSDLSRWLPLAVLALAVPLSVQADPVRIGDRILEIPAPAGFDAVSVDAPSYLEFAQSNMQPGMRLVEVYLTPEGMAKVLAGGRGSVGKRFQLVVPAHLEGVHYAQDEFDEFADATIAEIERVIPRAPDGTAPVVGAGTGAASVLRHGDIRREPLGLFYTTSMQLQSEGQEQVSGNRSYLGSASILVDGQIILLMGNTPDVGADGEEWAGHAISAWAEAIHAAQEVDKPAAPVVAAPPAADPPAGADATATGRGDRTDVAGLGSALLVGMGLLAMVVAAWVWKRRRPD